MELGWNCDDIDDQGLADRVYHGGAMGAYLVIDRKREAGRKLSGASAGSRACRFTK